MPDAIAAPSVRAVVTTAAIPLFFIPFVLRYVPLAG
jgi:hypothetical protein